MVGLKIFSSPSAAHSAHCLELLPCFTCTVLLTQSLKTPPTGLQIFHHEQVCRIGYGAGQQERFQNLSKDKETIVYCGSGVTACPNILALKLAGFQNVKLYAGSWSDWISYPENQIAKEED